MLEDVQSERALAGWNRLEWWAPSRPQRTLFLACIAAALLASLACGVIYFNTKLGLGASRSWVEIGTLRLERRWTFIYTAFCGFAAALLALLISAPFREHKRRLTEIIHQIDVAQVLRLLTGRQIRYEIRLAVSSVNWIRVFAVYTMIISVSAIAGYLAFEIHFRFDISKTYQEGEYPAIIYTEPEGRDDSGGYPAFPETLDAELRKPNPHIGHFKQDRDITLWFYDGKHNLRQEVNFHTNNLGFLSRKHYNLARQGPEYRIAILGDSMTGSTTTNFPWVDRVEDLLNADPVFRERLGARSVKVFNFGQPGAGFPQFASNFRMQAKLFEPDLVIVNYIEADFARRAAHAPKPGSKVTGGWVEYRAGPAPEDVARLNVTCEEPPVSLSNAACRQHFFFVMPRNLASDRAKVKQIKKDVVRDFLRGQLWTSPYPFALLKAFGYKVDLTSFRHPEVFHIQEMNDAEMIAQAAHSLGQILNDHPNVLITLNPTYGDVVPVLDPFRKTSALQAAHPSIHVVTMYEFMPLDSGQQEITRWYNVPHDGHFSDYGAELYAHAMVTVIKRRLNDSSL